MNTTNMSNMSYQAMLVHGQRQTQAQSARYNAKRVQVLHTDSTTHKAFTLDSSEKPIKDTPKMALFRPTARERLARHLINDVL